MFTNTMEEKIWFPNSGKHLECEVGVETFTWIIFMIDKVGLNFHKDSVIVKKA